MASGPPDDFDELRVHADALIERGDPRGELIAVGCALETRPTDGQLRQRHAQLSGVETRRLRALGLEKARFTWRCGHVDVLRIESTWGSAYFVGHLAADPAFARLRRLEVVSDGLDGQRQSWQDILTAIAARLPHLAELALLDARTPPTRGVEEDDGTPAGTPLRVGAIAPLLAALPALAVLEIEGEGIELAGLAHPALRRLRITDVIAPQAMAFGAARLPALEELAVHFGTWIPAAAVAVVIDADLPALRALALGKPYEPMAKIIEHLVRAPVLPRLRELALALIGPACIPPLVAHAAGFQHLERLQLELVSIGDDGRAQLVASLGPRVVFTT